MILKEERNVWHTLRRYALDHAMAIVVVGARGPSRIATVRLGSVSNGLVHHAPALLLVVPATANTHAPGRVVFCDDGSDHARRAINIGRRLLHGPGLVLSAWRSWVVNVPYMAVGASVAVGMAEDLDETAREHASTVAGDGAEMARAAAGKHRDWQRPPRALGRRPCTGSASAVSCRCAGRSFPAAVPADHPYFRVAARLTGGRRRHEAGSSAASCADHHGGDQ